MPMRFRLHPSETVAQSVFRERIIEFVEVLSVGDLNRHLARDTRQLIRARVRHHDDAHFSGTTRHRPTMLEHKRPAATVQSSRHPQIWPLGSPTTGS